LTAFGHNGLSNSLGYLKFNIGDDNASAFLCKAQSRGSTNASSGACNKCNLVFKAHNFSPA
jgi:hypothetical protein